MHLFRNPLQAFQIYHIVIQTAELYVDMEQIVPRLARNGIRLQFGHVYAIQLRQGAHQGAGTVIGFEIERCLIGIGRYMMVVGFENHKPRVIALYGVDFGFDDFQPEQLCRQFAGYGRRRFELPLGVSLACVKEPVGFSDSFSVVC